MKPATAPSPTPLLARLRPLLSLLGLCAAAALVWFVGPLLVVAGRAPLAGEPPYIPSH